jgi:hypothetical protein
MWKVLYLGLSLGLVFDSACLFNVEGTVFKVKVRVRARVRV